MKVIMNFRRTKGQTVKKILSILDGDAETLQHLQADIIKTMKKEGWELL